MSKNLCDCDIVFDLLPLYLDGKTGEESNEFIGKHLEECLECREVHRLMSAEVSQGDADSVSASDMLNQTAGKCKRRKSHKRARKKWVILVMGVLGYICLMFGIVVYMYWLLTNGVL